MSQPVAATQEGQGKLRILQGVLPKMVFSLPGVQCVSLCKL